MNKSALWTYTQTWAQTGVGVRVRLGAAIKRLLFTHFFHVVVTLDSTPPHPRSTAPRSIPSCTPLVSTHRSSVTLKFLGTFAFKMKSLFCFVFFVCLSFDKWMITWALGIDAIGRGRLSRQSVTASFHCHIVAKRLQRARADCFKNQFIPHYLLKIKVHIHPNYRFYPETLSSLALFCSVAAYWTAQPPCRPQTEGIF